MKRILSLTLGLALVLSLASASFGRDVVTDTRLHFEYSAAPPTPVTNTSVREDTFFLFAGSGPGAYGTEGTNSRGYTFDHSNGGPAAAGWAPYDLTAQFGTYWHLQDLTLSNGHATDFQSAGDFGGGTPDVNEFAWWCGLEDQCGWVHPTGYGFDWNQWLVLDVPDAVTAGTIEFDFVGDYEGDEWDFFTLYSRTGSADPVELLSNHTVGEQTVIHYGPVAFGDVDELIFSFKSDGNTCDQDGLFPTDIGAAWVDNFVIDYTGAADEMWDFESGNENDFPALSVSAPDGAGAWGALYANLFAEDVCIVNSTHSWAFFEAGNSDNPEYAFGQVPYGPPYVNNGIQSPLFEKAHALGDPTGMSVDDVHGGDSQFLVRFMVYRDLPLNTLVFFKSYVAAQVTGIPCLKSFASNTSVYYGDTKQWDDWFQDATLWLAASAEGGNVEGIAMRLNVSDECETWCNTYGDGTGHTPAPYFDMVSAMLVNSSSIAWNTDVFRRLQDNFHETSG
jgi:hypothetical protein